MHQYQMHNKIRHERRRI